jgi:hypothetical protein
VTAFFGSSVPRIPAVLSRSPMTAPTSGAASRTDARKTMIAPAPIATGIADSSGDARDARRKRVADASHARVWARRA